jgi:ubiquinone/menaquinone biosynthesis C-methylase UbiE
MVAMNSAKSPQERSYRRHSEHYREYSPGGRKEALAKAWLEKDKVDVALRHHRLYQLVDPILIADPKAKWLTVGDGRYGCDAKYILEKGGDALPSDISDILLKEAKDIGYIPEYKKENAESLSFQDSEFDYVFCKESYHHFPRPMLALYEMLRVAGKAVLLIEPNDAHISNNTPSKLLFRRLKNIIYWMLRRKRDDGNEFEEVGNYVFCISRRELEKVALGLNYKAIAFKGINVSYVEGVERESLSENGPLQRRVRRAINIRNVCSRLGLMDCRYLAAVIFKQEPSGELARQLAKAGYEFLHLPDNPYLRGQPPAARCQ